MPDLSVAAMMALSGAVGGIVSMFTVPLKYRGFVVRTALEAVESQQGRNLILAIAAERQLRIEDKLDQLNRSVDAVAKRLESRIDQMQANMTQQISKVDAEARQLEVRLVRIENHGR